MAVYKAEWLMIALGNESRRGYSFERVLPPRRPEPDEVSALVMSSYDP